MVDKTERQQRRLWGIRRGALWILVLALLAGGVFYLIFFRRVEPLTQANDALLDPGFEEPELKSWWFCREPPMFRSKPEGRAGGRCIAWLSSRESLGSSFFQQVYLAESRGVEVAAWIRTTGEDSRGSIFVQFLPPRLPNPRDSEWDLGQVSCTIATVSTEWTQVRFYSPVPGGTRVLRIGGYAQGTGEVYFDDFTVNDR